MEKVLDVSSNIRKICEEAYEEAEKVGTNDLEIMAVTKNVDVNTVKYARQAGINLFGENRVQEFLQKKDYFDSINAPVHLIGHLQSNKVKQAVGNFEVIQSVDSVRLASLISKEALARKIKQKVMLEINIGEEVNKYGFLKENIHEAVEEIRKFEGISIVGIMAIPPICEESELRSYFLHMRMLFVDINNKKMDNVCMKTLSMGMSGDYKLAIQEGSNMIRLGTAFFR